MPKITGTIQHNDWDEKPHFAAGAAKLNRADINCVFAGDLVGTARTTFVLAYPSETYAHYAGYLFVEGAIGDKAGSFVIYEHGDWEGGVARTNWTVVKNSGTGDFTGISGTGSYAAEHDKTVHYTIEYTL